MKITVENNIINNNTSDGVRAQSNDTSRPCLALTGNTSNDNYNLIESAGTTFTVVNRDGINAANTGTVSFNPVVGNFDTATSITNCPNNPPP